MSIFIHMMDNTYQIMEKDTDETKYSQDKYNYIPDNVNRKCLFISKIGMKIVNEEGKYIRVDGYLYTVDDIDETYRILYNSYVYVIEQKEEVKEISTGLIDSYKYTIRRIWKYEENQITINRWDG